MRIEVRAPTPRLSYNNLIFMVGFNRPTCIDCLHLNWESLTGQVNSSYWLYSRPAQYRVMRRWQ